MVCPFSTWSQTCGSWNFPTFLLKDGSLTLMYMASLMFLVSPCASLSTMVKHSGLSRGPVVDVCKCMGEGALRCSLYLSPSVLPDSPMYCPVQLMLGHLYLYMTPLLVSLGSLSLGAISNLFDSTSSFEMYLDALFVAGSFELLS